jgi:ribonuclease BN (tRNA processing enzyme)
MKVTILGTGGALPPLGRAQTGILLEKGDRCLLVDCGSGVLLRLHDAGIDVARLATILFTHHHLDHVSDLLPILVARWLRGHTHTRVYGPEGTEALVRAQLALYPYANEHITVEIEELAPHEHCEIAGFRVETLLTKHWLPTLAYRLDGRFAFSADTAPLREMAEFAKGCKLLLHECSFPDGVDAPQHTTPSALGLALEKCDVERLVLTHFYPEVQGREAEIISAVQERFSGEISLAEDLMRFEL